MAQSWGRGMWVGGWGHWPCQVSQDAEAGLTGTAWSGAGRESAACAASFLPLPTLAGGGATVGRPVCPLLPESPLCTPPLCSPDAAPPPASWWNVPSWEVLHHSIQAPAPQGWCDSWPWKGWGLGFRADVVSVSWVACLKAEMVRSQYHPASIYTA